jgi:ubiquinone/menaquinone biosynthesis C-methylase UbiE
LNRWRRGLLDGLSGRILEIGTGSGQLLVESGLPRPSIAIDLEPKNLVRARRRAPDVTFVEADAESLPFPDEFFDAVVASLVFCSIANPERAAHEIFRVLRPGGRVRLLDHVRVEGTAGNVLDRLTPAWKLVTGGCHLNRRTHLLLEEAGLVLTRREPHARGFVELVEATRPPG